MKPKLFGFFRSELLHLMQYNVRNNHIMKIPRHCINHLLSVWNRKKIDQKSWHHRPLLLP